MKFYVGIFLAALHLRPHPTAAEPIKLNEPVTPSRSCPCRLDYVPVCGTDGITYTNECILRCVSEERVCNGRTPIYPHRPGPCAQIQCTCSFIYLPLCGSDGQTYSNQCVLNCENKKRAVLELPPINVVSEGECPSLSCTARCSNKVLPVCGTDGITYKNICFLRCSSQRGPSPIFIKHNGPCSKETCICTADYSPVCGSDRQTYNNRCRLQCENRRRNALGLRPLTIKNDGPCYTCDCPKVKDPVCASDNSTYTNPCYLKCVNTARGRIRLPPLQRVSKDRCDCRCKEYFDPVCGTDDRNYDNICLLHCESVKRERSGQGRIRLAYGGPCVCDCSGCYPDYEPLCGSDGRTYWNRCWLDNYSACNLRRDAPEITPVGDGYC